MPYKVMYVCVNDSYEVGGSMTDLMRAAHGDWLRTLRSTQEVEVLVAVKQGLAVGAWGPRCIPHREHIYDSWW